VVLGHSLGFIDESVMEFCNGWCKESSWRWSWSRQGKIW
jgi:hypothetical protein